ncbi:TAXI family TRAP transporter solute-binding subunit [Aestuariivita sp.]|jgi:TRAP transporter TAXI family solute receptor|uniref:TAXI family TRAP transporter solute-binding subunit n=1 Tax=Aestuariivita sp. TaxID=1872407 RepID=UPI00216FF908|nr:TAXI family TRAP transporter solute-binding subunit [Aestuariivita sp.]MCE8009527.1 TAXI family TRAP transporter solute-binding subunit [Aestuariivita sp.]
MLLKQIKVVASATGLALATLSATPEPAVAQEAPDQITIFTSVSGSSWYGIGAGMAEIFAEAGVPSNPELGAGLSNVANVASGQGELGFTMSPAITVALRGDEPFGTPVENVAVIAGLSLSLMHIIVDAEEGFGAVSDLAGHPFITQRPGSITAVVFEELLSVNGMSPEDLDISTGSLTEQRDGLRDRRSDGMVSIASYPSSWGAELATTVPVSFLPISDQEYEALSAQMPTVGRSVIVAGTYKGQDEDVPTVTAKMIVVGAADMPEEEAYWIARTLAENIESVRALHASYATLTVEDMANVPGGGLHPGAARYYREVGALTE